MTLLPTLILAHLIADFPLQTDTIFRYKNQSAYGIWVHVLIHLGTTICMIHINRSAVLMLLIIGILHFCCDWFKIHYTDENQLSSFLADQTVHLLILVFCAYYFQSVEPIFPNLIVFPLLIYVIIPSLSVFLFVLGHDFKRRGEERPTLLDWAMKNGLNISHYFSVPLFVLLLFAILYR